MSGHTRKDKNRNEHIQEKVGVAPVEEMTETHLHFIVQNACKVELQSAYKFCIHNHLRLL